MPAAGSQWWPNRSARAAPDYVVSVAVAPDTVRHRDYAVQLLAGTPRSPFQPLEARGSLPGSSDLWRTEARSGGHVPGRYLARFVTGRYWQVNLPPPTVS